MYTPSPSNVLAAGVVLPVVCLVLVALRFTLRLRGNQNRVGIDDWILIPSWVLLAGIGGALIAGVALGAIGYPTPHPYANPLKDFTVATYKSTVTEQIQWAVLLMSPLQIGCVKLSFLFLYRRIFVLPSKRSSVFSILTWIGIGLVTAWAVAFFLAFLLSCAAVSGSFAAAWGSGLDLTTKCVQTEDLSTALSISDFIMDLYIIFLPIPSIWQLHMTPTRKLLITAVFLTGLVAVAASIVRMVIYVQALELGFNPHLDEDLLITTILYWTLIESGLALIAVCLPTLHAIAGLPMTKSLVNSVRSTFSLHSIPRQDSLQDEERGIQQVESTHAVSISSSAGEPKY